MFIEIFDHSMLAEFRRCPRYFYWRMVCDLTPNMKANEFKPAFGSAIHDALEIWYTTGDADLMDTAFIEYWMPFEVVEKGIKQKKIRNLQRGLQILELYRKRFPRENEPFILPEGDKLELGFTVELEKYLYCGKMDGLVTYDMGFHGLTVLEHKTSGAKGYLTIYPNYQADGYMYGASQLVGEPVLGVLFNQIYHPEPTKSDHKIEFLRELTTRSPEAMEAWRKDTIWLMDLINRCGEEKHWPKNPGQCFAYWMACPYKDLCTTCNQGMCDNLKRELYVEDKWNPHPDARGKHGGETKADSKPVGG